MYSNSRHTPTSAHVWVSLTRFSWTMRKEERGPSPSHRVFEEVRGQRRHSQFGLGSRTGSTLIFSADGLKLLMKF